MLLLLRLLINAGALWAATTLVDGLTFSGDTRRFLVLLDNRTFHGEKAVSDRRLREAVLSAFNP